LKANLKVHLSVVAAALVFSGCTMIPKYERPAAPVAAEYPRATTTNTNLPASEVSWTNFIAESRLGRLIALALANNRDLRVAMLNVEQSRAQYRIRRAALFPTVDATGSFTRSEASTSGILPGIGGSVGVSSITSSEWSASTGTTDYEVDLFGRIRSLNQEALEKYFSTVEARRSAQITLVAEVSIQYFALRQAQEQLVLARQTLDAVQESYSLNQATFDAGASTELDLRTAEGQVQTAKVNILDYERQMRQAGNALTLLVGEPIPADLPANGPFYSTNLLAAIPARMPSELVERRPDILEAEHTLRAANADIGSAHAAFFPRITLTTSIGTTSSQFSQLFGAGTGVWSFAPQVTLPIFAGGKLRADLDSSKISRSIEVANYEKAIQTAFREVVDALDGNTAYAAELTAESTLIAAQSRRYELANSRYRQGEDTYLNVLSAQQDLYSAQQNRLLTQYSLLASQISLYKALGGGWK
jgi:multidrug efflux system outer membrane protein